MTTPTPTPVTKLTAAQRVQLRIAGQVAAADDGPFVNPHQLHKAVEILRRRGEVWAAAILGHDLSRRSMSNPSLPWLNDGDDHVLVLADAEEDKAQIAELDFDPEAGQ